MEGWCCSSSDRALRACTFSSSPYLPRRVFRPAGTPDDSALSAGRAMTALHVLQDELPWACCERVGEGREAGVVAEVLFVGSFS